MVHEHFFQCPYCWEEISMLLDLSTDGSYVEDCEVCCNPIQVSYVQQNREITYFSAINIEQ